MEFVKGRAVEKGKEVLYADVHGGEWEEARGWDGWCVGRGGEGGKGEAGGERVA